MTEMDQIRHSIDEIDQEMARLFEQRMDAVQRIAQWKMQSGLPVEDAAREETLLRRNESSLTKENYRLYYAEVLKALVHQSKRMQYHLRDGLYVSTQTGGYEVTIRCGGLQRVGGYFNLRRKVLVVTDNGVPEDYVMAVASQCTEAIVFMFEQGEASKCISTYQSILQVLVDNEFTRSDCIVAVGGGVVGDVAGFAAATYMRGVDFYNVPTTLLAQVDSSIGGKTAIDFGGYKNLVGAFYPPKGVLIDTDVLQTLSQRQIANGMAEIIKMSLTHDVTLFETIVNTDIVSEDIIRRALLLKKQVVEADEREHGLRRVLNYGHTVGHAIEVVNPLYLHGECVALGMLFMCAPLVREPLLKALNKWHLPTAYDGDVDNLLDACLRDKKRNGDKIALVYVPEIGRFEFKNLAITDFEKLIREAMNR